MPKVRRSSYNLAFKLKVVAEAEAVENNSDIARDYGISESMVRRWRKDQANLFNGQLKMSAKRKTMGCFSPKYPELDQTLLDWFSEQGSQGIAVSRLILRLKAKELSSDPDFKASLGWYQRWKKCHSISLRTKTTLAQRLPQDLAEKIIQFHRFVIALRQRYGHSLSRLFNMDETPMRFEKFVFVDNRSAYSRINIEFRILLRWLDRPKNHKNFIFLEISFWAPTVIVVSRKVSLL